MSATTSTAVITSTAKSRRASFADHDERDLVDTRTAAELLHCSPRTLAAYRVTGRGPKFVTIGRAVRYEVAALLAYVREQTRDSTTE